MQPYIGITTGEISDAERPWGPVIYGQTRTYSDAVIRAGGIPLLIPLTTDVGVLERIYNVMDGILFAGGNDFSPSLYGQPVAATTVDASVLRDATETTLMKWILRDGKPMLGICRGMQLLNIMKGGSLYQHLPTDVKTASDHTISVVLKDNTYIAHQLKIKEGSALAQIIGSNTIAANSRHHQAIKTLGSGVEATAWSEDGVIEAIELPIKTSFAIGLQCHPECLEAKVVPGYQRLFRSFVEASRSTDKKRPLI